ncbi:putative 1,2-alpha-mannosidase [Zymoseptoria tritici IPO323]|uniref:alpha-1,2-Mannosidase n=1 Tax=Zymoseptoria tritici (strain CBS 115943 / IPO323) TaxID=336722 RepID=F9X7N5_ZYMTI|nr:putative 1,2-alpha-mannosidase [Zymoseptoria tritici IPO323]EGP88673.1 putative 1,2-alpha-mannosidase [Zymoseptoria tritici IPO323]
MRPLRRGVIVSTLSFLFFFALFFYLTEPTPAQRRRQHRTRPIDKILHPGWFKPRFKWKNVQQLHPVETFTNLPTGDHVTIPRIQHDFFPESANRARERERRLRAIEEAFEHSWNGYKENAWLHDEVNPLTGQSKNPFGGWGATLVDSLDTLWIMGKKKEFANAVSSLKKIDFTRTRLTEVNVFETTIRYLGGLLSAYDVSGHQYPILLTKAIDLGEMLYLAFDTPNRMPVTRWKWQNTVLGHSQEAKPSSLLAEVGSLTLEFTRLSQLTGNPKWYDAIARVTDLLEASQNHTKLPGLWPTMINTYTGDFTRDTSFTLGGMADSMYEYLPKQHLLLGGQTSQYQRMFTSALQTAREHVLFRPLAPDETQRILLPGTVRHSAHKNTLHPEAEHLACFAGGMVALAAQIFHTPSNLDLARELVDGCLWAYDSMPTGIMPELFTALPCSEVPTTTKNGKPMQNCTWSTEAWHEGILSRAHPNPVAAPTAAVIPVTQNHTLRAEHLISQNALPPGFTSIRDSRYILRPEAIESVFVLYRITGDEGLREKAWEMFESINKSTRTRIAYAAVGDVRVEGGGKKTLKYFYLIFSEPHVISLDDYVLNTEAHPLLRTK